MLNITAHFVPDNFSPAFFFVANCLDSSPSVPEAQVFQTENILEEAYQDAKRVAIEGSRSMVRDKFIRADTSTIRSEILTFDFYVFLFFFLFSNTFQKKMSILIMQTAQT